MPEKKIWNISVEMEGILVFMLQIMFLAVFAIICLTDGQKTTIVA